jgi:hypothetical protein
MYYMQKRKSNIARIPRKTKKSIKQFAIFFTGDPYIKKYQINTENLLGLKVLLRNYKPGKTEGISRLANRIYKLNRKPEA